MDFIDLLKEYECSVLEHNRETDREVLSLIKVGQWRTALEWLSQKLEEERDALKRFYINLGKACLEHMYLGRWGFGDLEEEEPLWAKYYKLFTGKEPVVVLSGEKERRQAEINSPVYELCWNIQNTGVFHGYYTILTDYLFALETEPIFIPIHPPRFLSEDEQDKELMEVAVQVELPEVFVYTFKRWGFFEASGSFWDQIKFAKRFRNLEEPIVVYPLYQYLRFIVEQIPIARTFLRKYLYFVSKEETPFWNAFEIAIRKVLGEVPKARVLSQTAWKILND